MKAEIFDGSPDDGELTARMSNEVQIALKDMGYDVETLQFRKMKMSKCTGCFGCWVKTPGQCTIDDEGRRIPANIIGTDLLVFLTPVTFGGYSSTIKVGLDRMLPILLPYFKNVGGETHHPLRYNIRYPFLLGVGILEESEREKEEIFAQLIGRNGRNMQGRGAASLILHRQDGDGEVKAKLSEVLKAGGMSA